MSRTILVVAEPKDGALRQVSYEAIGAARTAAGNGGTVAAVIMGSDVTRYAGELAVYGADHIYTVEHSALIHYHPEAYFAALQAVVQEVRPDGVFFGHTAWGKDLAPQLAAALSAGQISDVISMETDENGEVLFNRPIYAGKAMEKKKFLSAPWIVTIRPNNIPPLAAEAGRTAPVTAVAYPEPPLAAVIREVVQNTAGKMDLSEAKVIVSGGRGVRSAEGFQPLEELAAVLGGAVGASRGACDANYCDYALQIGQTGKVVTPELYIACGISGAIQHLAGMSQSRVIIAINKDPEAPIFQVADYGIVGDLFEVVPLLTEQFKQALQT
ncbi:electron transfer flavoprotein subunit alpha/FixB family protein [Paenibacillus apiarius]|uniref:Electron transfer flavoprotein subunit alpha/FixB family protein n=1 Tax=Paenibacillus apiarius TaxID=46240 RepID=A0ABT4DME5_9BACL|nr:electron transfer flavoprotein subunit alpha/FixB family protein [Paenibacillus apiarius]MCY9514534.1 electron transfer flavoprotein subunit alpha/FixB family protein [Paenibacillus apiarius]MCY9518524.1 electron transfer flavoprotein subunit alpha/FixB family protein [Paenibacillus apiarius]MCY9552612.1 electron transfer flavoprotein subunit alpha/FixB family protein [Paenibacillus apiarius]MCY9557060.1 electron transfer flavoprotein subunit alpha/FixB family protein [Paenibacillus apiarius